MAKFEWSPIKDLPEDWNSMASQELKALATTWSEQSEKLKESNVVKEFNERLAREWAIETGIIEHLYSIDRGVTHLLIEKGLHESLLPHGSTDKPAEYVIELVQDQKSALDGVFDFVNQSRELSNSYIKELHQQLTRNQSTVEVRSSDGTLFNTALISGDWKKLPNNPKRPDGYQHEYCPPVQTESEMDRLIAMHKEHVELNITPEIEAAWIHHRFTQIHPFQDGNGRVARALASLVFIRGYWFPLVINRDDRDDYITVLEAADKGNLIPVIKLFSKLQRKAFIRGLSLSDSVLKREGHISQIISAAKDKFLERERERRIQLQEEAFYITAELEAMALKEFYSVETMIQKKFKSQKILYVKAERSTEETDYWFARQIIVIARILDYFADSRSYRSWVRLRIREQQQTEIVVSFHALGYQFTGTMAVSAFIEHRYKGEDGNREVENPHKLCTEVFQFSNKEDPENIRNRFRTWITDVTIVGLDQWRKKL